MKQAMVGGGAVPHNLSACVEFVGLGDTSGYVKGWACEKLFSMFLF